MLPISLDSTKMNLGLERQKQCGDSQSQRDDITWASGLAPTQPQGHRALALGGEPCTLSLRGGDCGRVQTEGSIFLL